MIEETDQGTMPSNIYEYCSMPQGSIGDVTLVRRRSAMNLLPNSIFSALTSNGRILIVGGAGTTVVIRNESQLRITNVRLRSLTCGFSSI
jgi:hypothetical protein